MIDHNDEALTKHTFVIEHTRFLHGNEMSYIITR